jgi:hypothetical protein
MAHRHARWLAIGLLLALPGHAGAARILGALERPASSARSVAAERSYAYAYDLRAGALESFDFTDPGAPAFLGALPLAGPCELSAAPGRVFCATPFGVTIVDVANPAAPDVQGTFSTTGEVDAAIAEGDRLYVGGAGGLWIVDISDPEAPAQLGRWEAGWISDVALAGTLAYTVGADGLRVLDVSDPTDPADVGGVAGCCDDEIEVADGRAYVRKDRQLIVYDLASPTAPVYRGNVGAPWTADAGAGLRIVAGTAWMAVGANGLLAIDVGDPSAPRIRGALAFPNETLDVDAAEGRLYALGRADFSALVLAVDPSDPRTPRNLRPPGPPFHALWRDSSVILGRHLYASGLRVFDVGAPATAAQVGELPGVVGTLAGSGSRLYAGSAAGLSVVDLTAPASPQLLALLDAHPGVVGLLGELVVVAGDDGIEVLDLADPLAPDVVGTLGLPLAAQDLAVAGDVAFVLQFASSKWRVQVVDLSDPSQPLAADQVEIAWPEGTEPPDVEASGTTLFVSLDRYDASNPYAVTPLAPAADPVPVDDLVVAGDRAFTSSYETFNVQIVRVYDTSSPAGLAPLSGLRTQTGAGGIAFDGRLVYGDWLSVADFGAAVVPAPGAAVAGLAALASLAALGRCRRRASD